LAESPTNPFMRCLDFPAPGGDRQTHGVLTVVDSTFATPYNLRPLQHGADLVVHSLTKYLSGHNDVMAGAVVGRYDADDADAPDAGLLRQPGRAADRVPDPARHQDAGAARRTRQNVSGLAMARFLEATPKCAASGIRCWQATPTTRSPRRPCAAAAAWSASRSTATPIGAHRFIDALRIPTIGPSLGGVETMVSPLAVMGYANRAAGGSAGAGHPR
jgi:cystathionine gamma-synthase